MEECKSQKQIQKTTKIIKKLYEIDSKDLCEDELKLLYMLLKKLRKKIKNEKM